MLDIARGHRHLLLNRADDAVGISTDKVEAILGHGGRRPGGHLDRDRGRHQRRQPDRRHRSRSTSPAPRSSSLAARIAGDVGGIGHGPVRSTGPRSRCALAIRPVPAQEGGRRVSSLCRPPRRGPHDRRRAPPASTPRGRCHRGSPGCPPDRPDGGRRIGAPLRAGGPVGGALHPVPTHRSRSAGRSANQQQHGAPRGAQGQRAHRAAEGAGPSAVRRGDGPGRARQAGPRRAGRRA